jgi:putative transposase
MTHHHRSTLYYQPAPVSDDDLTVMRRLDEQYLLAPFYGARRMVAVLRRDGFVVNRKRIRRLMRVMGIEAIYQKPNTSRGHPEHKVYPYLLRGMAIEQSNQVWCADITYIPMAKGFVYLVAVMDWFSRRVLAWRQSIGMDTDFCVEALQEAWSASASRRCSTRIKGCSSPVQRFSMNWKVAVCGSAWTAKAGFSTASSLKGCDAA